MSDELRFDYSIYITADASAIWHALTDEETSGRFWGHRNVSDWAVGSTWEHRRMDGSNIADVVGTVTEADRPHRLATTWADPTADNEDHHAELIVFTIDGHGDIARLTVAGQGFADPETRDETRAGFSAVFSNLKTLLETGHPMPTNPWELS